MFKRAERNGEIRESDFEFFDESKLMESQQRRLSQTSAAERNQQRRQSAISGTRASVSTRKNA